MCLVVRRLRNMMATIVSNEHELLLDRQRWKLENAMGIVSENEHVNGYGFNISITLYGRV